MARKLTEQQTGTEPEATPAGPARLRTTGPSAVAASLTYATIWAPWRPMGPPTNATGRWGERPMRLLLNGTRSAEVPDEAEFISLPPPPGQPGAAQSVGTTLITPVCRTARADRLDRRLDRCRSREYLLYGIVLCSL